MPPSLDEAKRLETRSAEGEAEEEAAAALAPYEGWCLLAEVAAEAAVVVVVVLLAPYEGRCLLESLTSLAAGFSSSVASSPSADPSACHRRRQSQYEGRHGRDGKVRVNKD